jgi:glycerol kinase
LAIANQSNSFLVWEKNSGDPVYPAIIWQDRRIWKMVEELTTDPLRGELYQKTGIIPGSSSFISKLRWVLDMVPDVRKRAEGGELIAGTLDSWLLWKMTGGLLHATDYSNAGTTGLFNLRNLNWDEELLKKVDIPKHLMAREIKPSAANYGLTKAGSIGVEIPIAAVAGDQHAAMLGYGCINEGEMQATMGTGTFLLINTGRTPLFLGAGLATRIGFATSQTVQYALEGIVFHSGTAIDFLVRMGFLNSAKESLQLATSVPDAAGVYFIPAFSGLGTPRWITGVRGAILGLTQGTTRAHVVRACLEAIGYQIEDILRVLKNKVPFPLKALHVGGGIAENDFVLQFLADITGMEVQRSANPETTVLGATRLAMITMGEICQLEDIPSLCQPDQSFKPKMEPTFREACFQGWVDALAHVTGNYS